MYIVCVHIRIFVNVSDCLYSGTISDKVTNNANHFSEINNQIQYKLILFGGP